MGWGWTEDDVKRLQAKNVRASASPAKKPRKYRNEPTFVDGIRFDSKHEAARYQELRLLEKAGKITDLRRQVRYALVVGHVLICEYISDFVYRDDTGSEVVEDAKGVRDQKYPIKKRLMLACYGIEIREV